MGSGGTSLGFTMGFGGGCARLLAEGVPEAATWVRYSCRSTALPFVALARGRLGKGEALSSFSSSVFSEMLQLCDGLCRA